MTTQKIKRRFQGKVVSDRMSKTIVVLVSRRKMHPKYKKYYTVSERYKVHDEKNQYKIGEVVEFEETRPISRDKRWRVIRKVD